jgi:hypothetical protein
MSHKHFFVLSRVRRRSRLEADELEVDKDLELEELKLKADGLEIDMDLELEELGLLSFGPTMFRMPWPLHSFSFVGWFV